MLNKTQRTKSLVASAARATSSDSGVVVLTAEEIYQASAVIVELDVTQASGTSPTLDVYLQQSLDGSNFIDIAHLTQITASSATKTRIVLSVADLTKAENAIVTGVGDATTSAGQLSGIPLVTNRIRLKWTIGGTSPAFTFSADAQIV